MPARTSKPFQSVDADIKEIRQEFSDFTSQWHDIREEGRTDMRYIAGDPWDPKDRRDRKRAHRPCITTDELSQYVNQLINDIRQNKRAVKLAPKTEDSTQQSANFRQDLIRQIEYESNAESQAYIPMFENAVQRSYGYLRVKSEWTHFRSPHQVLRVVGIPNPDHVTPDPYSLSTTGEDWKRLYFTESYSITDFKSRWGSKATIVDFGSEAQKAAPDWIKANRVMVGERWKVTTTLKKLVMVQPPLVLPPPGQPPQPKPQPIYVFDDEVKDLGKGHKVIKEVREVEYPKVTQQFTNGLEILETHAFPGTSIPFVGCYGKVLYVDEGAGAERKMLSLIRLARDPFMAYCWLRTLEVENIGLATRFPYFTYEGQLSASQEQLLAQSNHEPIGVIKVKPTLDGVPIGSGPLPFPQRNLDEPQVQAIEMAAESFRRAIQAAIGGSPLPTEAQRVNEKSGVALNKIDDNTQRGTFHLIDHYENAITRVGQLLDELIPFYYDSARTVTIRKPNDQPIQVRINDPSNAQSQNATDGQHDAILSVGPAYQSAREAASDFADTIIASAEILQILGPQKAQQLIAQAIKLKDVGPIGDEMADIISPPPQQNGQPPTPEMVQQLQGELQAAQQQIAALTMQIKAKTAEETVRQQGRMAIESMKTDKTAGLQLKLKEIDSETKLAVAELSATVNKLSLFFEERARLGLQMHEGTQNALDRAHDVGLAALDHAQTTQQADQAHTNAMAQGAASSDQTMVQDVNRAALQPPEQTGEGPGGAA